jgi:hypothetical protein
MRKQNVQGVRFGRLIAINEVDPQWFIYNGGKYKRTRWLCKCDCGQSIYVTLVSLRSGNTKSCGCIQKDGTLKKNYVHGESHKETKEYRTWNKIKGRCYCKTDLKYHDYGGRGISVCDRWINSYDNFLSDMGRCPRDKYSIERINNNGNYEPSNCKWATRKEQAQNKRTTIYLEMDGITLTMKAWCEKLGLRYDQVRRQTQIYKKTLKEIMDKKLCIPRV